MCAMAVHVHGLGFQCTCVDGWTGHTYESGRACPKNDSELICLEFLSGSKTQSQAISPGKQNITVHMIGCISRSHSAYVLFNTQYRSLVGTSDQIVKERVTLEWSKCNAVYEIDL